MNIYLGFGQVYLGLWNGKYIAIKKFNLKHKHEVNPSLNSLKNNLNKFIKEINIISNLRHPNITLYIGSSINYLAANSLRNEYYLITEYIGKGSLFDFLHVLKLKFSCLETLSIIYEIAIALKYLHSRDILHCDLKSSNILLDDNFKIKVSDFGLSKLYSILSNDYDFKGRVGTPHWMPPEVMLGKQYLKESDVFSYGMIIWEMIYCEIPYYGLTPNQIIGIVGDYKKIVEVKDLNSGNNILKSLKFLAKNCLNYEPEKRPSFDEIIKYLEVIRQKTKNHSKFFYFKIRLYFRRNTRFYIIN
jgi:serine/threonine protein kinase